MGLNQALVARLGVERCQIWGPINKSRICGIFHFMRFGQEPQTERMGCVQYGDLLTVRKSVTSSKYRRPLYIPHRFFLVLFVRV